MSQLIGTLAFGIFAFILSLILAIILKSAGMWRVDAEEEEEGLDIAEHGSHAYPDFVSVAEK